MHCCPKPHFALLRWTFSLRGVIFRFYIRQFFSLSDAPNTQLIFVCLKPARTFRARICATKGHQTIDVSRLQESPQGCSQFLPQCIAPLCPGDCGTMSPVRPFLRRPAHRPDGALSSRRHVSIIHIWVEFRKDLVTRVWIIRISFANDWLELK